MPSTRRHRRSRKKDAIKKITTRIHIKHGRWTDSHSLTDSYHRSFVKEFPIFNLPINPIERRVDEKKKRKQKRRLPAWCRVCLIFDCCLLLIGLAALIIVLMTRSKILTTTTATATTTTITRFACKFVFFVFVMFLTNLFSIQCKYVGQWRCRN